MPAGRWPRRFFLLGVLLALGFAIVGDGFLPGRGMARADVPDVASVGLFDPVSGTWYLQDLEGGTTQVTGFGQAGDVPLVGDWDGDGRDTPALYRPAEGRLLVRGSVARVAFVYPMPAGGLPVVADTDGDGRDAVSIARGGRLFVMHELGMAPGSPLILEPFPPAVPWGTEALVAWDVDGDGSDEIAAVHRGVVSLVTPAGADAVQYLGSLRPLAGDWDGNGQETLGGYDVWRSEFRFYDEAGFQTTRFAYGSTGMLPVAGTFGDLAGRDEPPPRRAGLPAIGLGEQGPQVRFLQEELTRRRLYRGPLDGVFTEATSFAVMAFHKVLEVERTWVWEEGDSLRMAAFRLPPLPERPEEPDRVEVDIGRQVMYVFRRAELVAIVPISSGGGYKYYSDFREKDIWAITPRGDFTIYRHVVGWDWVQRPEGENGRCRPLSGDFCVYSPWNFAPWIALHGYIPVPEVPVSHGCVRMSLWDADALESVLFVGMPIHVWDVYPAD
jgi:hypothetical protein